MNQPSSERLTMNLLTTVEAMAEPGRAPRPPVPIPELPAPLRAPETLTALWSWCGGEQTSGLFLLAHALLDGFPHDEGSLEHATSNMSLVSPEHAVPGWDHEPADWLKVGDDGAGDCLVVDGDGAVWVWSSDVDVEPVQVHPSFDRWMRALGEAIEQGRVRVSSEAGRRLVLVDEAWVYDLDDYGWMPASDVL